jgi:hypothetical protein
MLKEFFLQNRVRAIKVVIFKNEKGDSKGSGIIEFSSSQDSEYVVGTLNGAPINGVPCSFYYDGGSQGGAGGYGRGRY